jgi:hypothetical protein
LDAKPKSGEITVDQQGMSASQFGSKALSFALAEGGAAEVLPFDAGTFDLLFRSAWETHS